MANSKPSIAILRAHLDAVKQRVAEAGFKVSRETVVDDARVRLHFASMPDADIARLMGAIPRDALGHVGIGMTPEVMAQLHEAHTAGPDALKELMEKLADKGRSKS